MHQHVAGLPGSQHDDPLAVVQPGIGPDSPASPGVRMAPEFEHVIEKALPAGAGQLAQSALRDLDRDPAEFVVIDPDHPLVAARLLEDQVVEG